MTMTIQLQTRTRVRLLCATALAAFSTGNPASANDSAPAAQYAADADDRRSGEIIVTAQRRNERAQDVPISITAFSPERLQQQGISQPQDLQGSVPSLTAGNNGTSSREAQSFTIRGQGASYQASPGVVVYLNEVPLPSAISLTQQGGAGNYVDLENIQVLNGPQGTLFGRNSTGGAVLLVSHKPTNEFEGYVQAKFGSYDNRELEGVVNVPIVGDKVLLRVAAAYQKRDGYTHDVIWDKDRDDMNWHSGRIGLTLRPTETFENYTMVYGASSKNNGSGLIHREFNISQLTAYGMCHEAPTIPNAIVSCDVYRAATSNAKALGPRKTAFGLDTFQQTKTWGITNTSTFEIDDQLTLRNIVSYQRFRSRYANDADATVLQQEDDVPHSYLAPGKVTMPSEGTPLDFGPTYPAKPADDIETITEELQLQGNFLDNHLNVTAGAFYFNQRPTGTQSISYISYCPAAFTGHCGANVQEFSIKSLSKALYAQATLDFGAVLPALESLKLTAGYRNTWDEVTGVASAYVFNTDPAAPGTVVCKLDPSIIGTPADCTFGATLKTSKPTWTIGLDYRFSPALMIYGRVSRGYKSGGFNPGAVFNATRVFGPEFVTSYEGGIKSNFRIAGMASRFNAAYYHVDYANIQRAAGDFNSETGQSGSRTDNASARIKGVEIEGAIYPVKGLEIGGTFSYTNAKYKKYEYTAAAPTQDCSGSIIPAGGTASLTCLPFQFVSPYTYSFHVSADQPLPGDLGTITMFVNYAHSASKHTTSALILPGEPAGEKLEPFGTLNVSVDWRDIGKSGLDVGFYATNLANKTYRVSHAPMYNFYSFTTDLYAEPRMYGIRTRYSF